mmetsp:Transcript_34984/g.75752  ORF Transcript_34984/g.75752 Transcript_34984/m.75752 type:complete len:240 (-) Transcript_34984:355-1074(-)
MRSAMVMVWRPCSLAKSKSWSRRIMVPSLLTSSQRTPAGKHPPSLARSTAASVCPARLSTPPSLHRSGKMCPGLLKSSGLDPGEASAWSVATLSAAEMPVLVPFFRSTETVNAVPMASLPFSTIWCRPSRSKSSPSMPTQMSPLVWFTMNAQDSLVIFSAAMMRSPSFSLSSSSSTTTNFPLAMSWMASWMESNPGVGLNSSLSSCSWKLSETSTSAAETSTPFSLSEAPHLGARTLLA